MGVAVGGDREVDELIVETGLEERDNARTVGVVDDVRPGGEPHKGNSPSGLFIDDGYAKKGQFRPLC